MVLGLSVEPQTFESAKSPVTRAPINKIETLPPLCAVIFFALLFLPSFVEKVTALGETTSGAATVGIGVGVSVAVAVVVAVAVSVAVGVAVGLDVGVGDMTGVRTVEGVAETVGVVDGVDVAVTVAVAVAVEVVVAVAEAVAVGVPVADAVEVADAVGVLDRVSVAVGDDVPVRVAVGVIDAVGVGVRLAEPAAVGVDVGVVPGEPSPDNSNIPRPWVAANITPLRFCSISKTATAGIVPRLNGTQVFPASVVLKMPMSVAARTVFAVGSLRSTSNRKTGTSGSAFAGGGL